MPTITNNRPTILHLPDISKREGGVAMAGQALNPGESRDFDEQYVKALRDNRTIQNFVSAGYLTVEGMTAQNADTSGKTRLSNDTDAPLGQGAQNVSPSDATQTTGSSRRRSSSSE